MNLASLASRYAAGETPADLAPSLHEKACKLPETFIHVTPLDELLTMCSGAMAMPESDRGPLWGGFFAAKDNIDVAGQPTTAACPKYSYTPTSSSPAAEALLSAGAICLGKVNMDQFAAGLVGTRSPHGVPINALDARVIPGGSSSGSASAVAGGIVSFALGTDTAGSGRIPAGLQSLVGVKPSVGLVSTKGVVPACASLDCVSVFATTVADGAVVAAVMAGATSYPSDATVAPRSNPNASVESWASKTLPDAPPASTFTFAVPDEAFLNFEGPRGNSYAKACRGEFELSVERLISMGGTKVALDFAPLVDTAKMLYGTSFVAERAAGIAKFLGGDSAFVGGKRVRDWLHSVASDERLLPVTRSIIGGAAKFNAADVFGDLSTLRVHRAAAAAELARSRADFLLVPTVMHHYLAREVLAQEDANPPVVAFNSKLGTFTNFVNLLDMCAIALPSSTLADVPLEGEEPLKLAFGVTLIGKGGEDGSLWHLAKRFEEKSAA